MRRPWRPRRSNLSASRRASGFSPRKRSTRGPRCSPTPPARRCVGNPSILKDPIEARLNPFETRLKPPLHFGQEI